MIKLKTLLDESFGGMLAAAIRANNAQTPHKNKFKVDPKQVKIGDELEWYGKDKDSRVTGTILKIDSKGIEITNLKAVGTKKMDYGLKGVTINANTKYFYFGPNKMLNHWKLKDSQDTDQNNNGYPDGTEGNLRRNNVDTHYTKTPIAKADLITKLQPLKKLFPKITDRDLKALTFVGTKSDTTKIYKALGALSVQDYFDPPNDDSEFSGPGTWVIDTMSASDDGLIK